MFLQHSLFCIWYLKVSRNELGGGCRGQCEFPEYSSSLECSKYRVAPYVAYWITADRFYVLHVTNINWNLPARYTLCLKYTDINLEISRERYKRCTNLFKRVSFKQFLHSKIESVFWAYNLQLCRSQPLLDHEILIIIFLILIFVLIFSIVFRHHSSCLTERSIRQGTFHLHENNIFYRFL